MVAISMFWAALAAGIFFLLGAAFKVVIAACHALLSSIGNVISLLIKILFLFYVLELIREAAAAMGTEQFGLQIAALFGGAFMCALFFIFRAIGSAILGLFIRLMEHIIDAILFIFICAERACDRIYIKSIRAIVNRLEKC